jgi:hypothetical protein
LRIFFFGGEGRDGLPAMCTPPRLIAPAVT